MSELQAHTSVRRDAAENRERIIQAARELYAQTGVGVTLHDVVRHAGYGVGTAYRNFLNKEELIDIVFVGKLQTLVDEGRRCLDGLDPWLGLAQFLEVSLRMQSTDRGFGQVLFDPVPGAERLDAAREEVSDLIAELVDRLNGAGLLRPGIVAADVQRLHAALSQLIDRARPVDSGFHRKYLGIVLDGLHAP